MQERSTRRGRGQNKRQTRNYVPETPVDSDELDEVDDDCYYGECGRRYDEDGELWIGYDGGCEALVWMKRKRIVITAPTDCHFPLYPSYTLLYLTFMLVVLFICPLYSLYAHLYLPSILFIKLFTCCN